jgi:hypothetical protein
VKKAIQQGELPMEVVDEKLLRILRVKLNQMQIRANPLTDDRRKANRVIEEKCARKAITLVSDKKSNWPVDMDSSVVCINSTPRGAYSKINNIRGIGPNQDKPAFDIFKEELEKLSRGVSVIDNESLNDKISLCREADTILLITEDYPLPGEDFPKEEQQVNVRRVLDEYGDKVIIIGLIPKVIRNDGIPTLATKNPLINPNSIPTIVPQRTLSTILLVALNTIVVIMADKDTIDPKERSISAAERTKVIPTAIIAIIAD